MGYKVNLRDFTNPIQIAAHDILGKLTMLILGIPSGGKEILSSQLGYYIEHGEKLLKDLEKNKIR